ncbi:MAG: hypothetical protein M1150_03985 [Patescibacteria group bacterium]|nr:hypothetical protein [Patescibacteria group bacterium]
MRIIILAIVTVGLLWGSSLLLIFFPTQDISTLKAKVSSNVPTPVIVSGKPVVPYPRLETEVIELPPIGEKALLLTDAKPKQMEARPLTTPTIQSPKAFVQPTFYLKSADGKEDKTFTSLEKIEGQYRPWYYDEAHGGEIKVVLDKPARDFLIVSDDDRRSFEFLTPWSARPDGKTDINEVSGNIYYFNRDRSIWAYPKKDARLEVLNGRREDKEKVGQLIYGPWMLGQYSTNGKQLLLAKDFLLETKQNFASIREFEQFIGEQNTVGLLMGEADAKRFAYYNGQPLAKVEDYYGWSLPNKDGQLKGKSMYTHLGLAYDYNVGYDTPIQYGGVTFVNVKRDPKLFLHGTLLKDGKSSEWK